MGGEKLNFVPCFVNEMGSPPHGRGKVTHNLILAALTRITPAWAGKSPTPYYISGTGKDHPRMGGEKLNASWVRMATPGSPPHGRGKGCGGILGLRVARITPAWAGKSSAPLCCGSESRDHPRMGGEKDRRAVGPVRCIGSPPHGRGKGRLSILSSSATGITPAWAGKRLKRSHRSGIFISEPIPFHSVLHRPAGSGGSRAGRDGSPAGQPQNAGPA